MYLAKDIVREPLYCIVPLHNPWRHKSRWKLTQRAIKHFMDSGAVLVLVEVAFNRREFVFANDGIDGLVNAAQGPLGSDPRFRHRYIALHSRSEIWLKENIINVAATRLPFDWAQMAWLDSDVYFVRPNWVDECVHKLQHYDFVQMFSQARDVGPDFEELPETYPHSMGVSFMHAYHEGTLDLRQGMIRHKKKDAPKSYPGSVWPGLAWACTRRAFDKVGGLFDVAVWGGGDYDMAHALVEQASNKIHPDMHEGYKRLLLEWEARCKRHIRKNVGVMNGLIHHYWHGKKSDRKYAEKRTLMRMVKFDPLRFLKRDFQGLWQLQDDDSEQFVQFRDMMRRIAGERKEDSIDV